MVKSEIKSNQTQYSRLQGNKTGHNKSVQNNLTITLIWNNDRVKIELYNNNKSKRKRRKDATEYE